MTELVRKVEAILFAASKRMSTEEIGEFFQGVKTDDIKSSLDKLQKDYQTRDTSLLILCDDENWKISLKDEFLPLAEGLMPSTDLPKPVIETLAVIAWKNPILQSDLVKMRSPVVYDHIFDLEKIKLITRTKKGRSYILRVTEKFYDYFDTPQMKTADMLGQYEEPKEEKHVEEINIFNKGDTFDENEEVRNKRLIQEIKNNKIDPEAIIREDKEFLDNFENRLNDIKNQSDQANKTLKEIDRIEIELKESVEEKIQESEIKVNSENENLKELNLEEEEEESIQN